MTSHLLTLIVSSMTLWDRALSKAPLRLLVLLFVCLIPQPALTEAFFYVSDSAAFPGKEIPDPSRGTDRELPEFYLKIETKDGIETRTLFKNGKEYERREIVSATSPASTKDRVFRSGRLEEEQILGSRKEVLEERHYDLQSKDEIVEWREIYTYAGMRLIRVERFDTNGKNLGSMSYHYDPRGRLGQIDLLGYFGQSSEGAVPGASLPRLTWADSSIDTTLRIDRFDEAGNISGSRWTVDGKEMAASSYHYAADGTLLSLTYSEVSSATRTFSAYDKDEHIILEEIRKNDLISSRREMSYGSQGKLESEIRTFPPPREIHTYIYEESGALSQENIVIAGLLARVLLHGAGGMVTEETYSKGKIVARTYYQDGFKTREEFIVNGQVARERRY